ncbi:MAG: tryptophan--tRNA ligase [Candidatus Colwellbacteria bacterium RIFCSPLOWO2_12_FULL_44_13]|uniref:Tryptophan--tRNA ligase n=3 Tax=Candidatus Colwelliibacteriota TaxID=1817904 RepID=A0A1G1Z718_9BACT|nr:MAG: tryptophan--tRNA ligase [Candidatus Colwellbacteria bacterium RIFCSPHIGHO2_12_FULL_44_17]OGY60229.1 MAG: tryptophan--tRNA ligase [Candidatus Colwellbacteria bacterium RIFCSPLOWO2_02_FULL_44_20b]OGY62037.1 MAG: tryptophan--tRNA ligase [Candidatus Colwellbacteria bacterium RIFCSPLOWO2_12_FULL_44_13]
MKKPIVVSGIKPTGILHIGNYLGMLKNAVALQESNKYECFYFVADYHALTQRYDPKEKAKEIFDIAVDILAAGIDPKKSTIFLQSHIPEHANLAWIFNTITSMGMLERMVEYKEKLSEGHVPNVGLFDYPVLMAADILIYKGEYVPIGDDQRQHLELARDIVRTFNGRFGKTFKEPQGIYTKAVRIMSLDKPEKKMSKSLPNGCLYLTDSPEVIRKKVKAAVTDSFSEVGYDPEKRPAIANLLTIYSSFSGELIEKIVSRYKGKRYVEFKSDLAEVVVSALEPFQKKQKEFMKNKKYVMSVLEEGEKKARPIAERVLAEAKKRVGLI